MKDIKIKILCMLLGHKWMYENKPALFPERQCDRCGLVHERFGSRWVGHVRYKNKGFKTTQQDANDQSEKWKDEKGIIE